MMGRGARGYWRINLERPFDQVIIYRRHQESGTNEVFTAVPAEMETSPVAGRWVIRLAKIEMVGTTELNWPEFAETGSNPIRYL